MASIYGTLGGGIQTPGASTVTATPPSGIVDGDLLLAYTWADHGVAVTVPASWGTAFGTQTLTTPNDQGTTTLKLYAWAASSEPASYSLGLSASTCYTVCGIAGVHGVGGLSGLLSSGALLYAGPGTTNPAGTTSIPPPSLSPGTSPCHLLVMFGYDGQGESFSSFTNASYGTALTGPEGGYGDVHGVHNEATSPTPTPAGSVTTTISGVRWGAWAAAFALPSFAAPPPSPFVGVNMIRIN